MLFKSPLYPPTNPFYQASPYCRTGDLCGHEIFTIFGLIYAPICPMLTFEITKKGCMCKYYKATHSILYVIVSFYLARQMVPSSPHL